MNSKLHAVCDGMGRPVVMLLSEGQMSDYKGVRLIVNDLPLAKHLLADRGYDADWFREALEGKGIKPCIPSKKNRKIQITYDKTLYKQPTKSRTCSANSKTGAASQHDMTAAHTPSFQLYALPLLLSSI
jgi:putative transposase